MIGKPEWFKYRIFGWGVAPKTWQAWVYVVALAAIFGVISALPIAPKVKTWVVGGLFVVLIIDVIHIMMQLPKNSDERDNYHQLIIERNCSFAAIAALIGVAIYQAYKNRALIESMAIPFDISIAIVLGVSTVYVKTRM
jgi:hypothetical protein